MPQSLSSLPVHLIFSTKDRCPFLGKSDLLQPTHTYLGAILRRVQCPAITKQSQLLPGNVAMVVSRSENPRQRPWCNTLPAKPSIIKGSVSKTNFEKCCASTALPSTSVTYGTNGFSRICRAFSAGSFLGNLS